MNASNASRCEQCPVPASIACPLEGWPGHCALREYRVAAYRSAVPDRPPAAEDEARIRSALALVADCPHRGPVLPVSRQPECGCGGELSECRAGRGPSARPSAVTLRECLDCVAG